MRWKKKRVHELVWSKKSIKFIGFLATHVITAGWNTYNYIFQSRNCLAVRLLLKEVICGKNNGKILKLSSPPGTRRECNIHGLKTFSGWLSKFQVNQNFEMKTFKKCLAQIYLFKTLTSEVTSWTSLSKEQCLCVSLHA